MKLRKARIIIQPIESVKQEWVAALKGKVQAIQGDQTIVFTSMEALGRILTPARLVLLKAIIKEKPRSMYALAKLLGRNFKNVHSDVRLLAEVGLLELKTHGRRESKNAVTPVAKFSGFELDLAA